MSAIVSVVVPAFNAALYLKQTLESIIAQSDRHYEIIVVDDGSTDETPLIAQQFGDAIRYIHQPNLGLSAARNTAIKNARAEVIALLDADDLWEPQFLERMIPFLNLHPEAAGVYCGFQYINSRGDVVGTPSLKVVPPELFHSKMVDDGNWLAPCGVIFRKRLAEQAGLFDESLHAVEDWDLWIRLSENRPFIGLPEALVKYRRHENNMTKDPERMINAIHQLTIKLHGPPDGDISKWAPAKRKAYGEHYLGGAISFFASGKMEKSVYYLIKVAEVSIGFTCSLYVWRRFARAFIPDEYQFDESFPDNWNVIDIKINELLGLFFQKTESSSWLNSYDSRIKGFAFLGLADEAGRAGELRHACRWLLKAIRSDIRMPFTRPAWGTVYRIFKVQFAMTSKISKTRKIYQ
jgi:glycosyltransferase involved in cell wall biosynthesis